MQREFDLTDVNRDKLLECLWKASYPAAFFEASGVKPPPYDPHEAKRSAWHGYVDYACGRCIKTQIFDTTVIRPRYECIPEQKFVRCVEEASSREKSSADK